MLIKVITIHNNETLIAQIEETSSELGEPDCKLIKPYIIKNHPIDGLGFTMEPWNSQYTNKDTFMIHSDKILTIMDPKPTLLEKYESLIK